MDHSNHLGMHSASDCKVKYCMDKIHKLYNFDDAYKLVYQWVKTSYISQGEFITILKEIDKLS